MSDVVLLLVAAAVLGLLGILAAHGWVADSRDQAWTGPTFTNRCLR
jgi:Flp pilus assembly protein CpaB